MNGHFVKAGNLLISDPYMRDSTFKKSVVLLCENETELGSVGFILNKPLKVKMKELIEDLKDFHGTIYYGGPVAPDTLHFIHTKGDIIDDSVDLGKGVFWGGDFEQVKFLIANEIVKSDEIRFFLGYSGWSEGQLSEEMEGKSWIVADLDINYIFGKPTKIPLWNYVMSHLGITHSIIANTTDSTGLN